MAVLIRRCGFRLQPEGNERRAKGERIQRQRQPSG
jgi:hypothetical protein